MAKPKPNPKIELVIDQEVAPWKGDISELQCSVTGERALFFDRYCNAEGEEVPVSANASHKILTFLRLPEALHVQGPHVFTIYGREVHISYRCERGVRHRGTYFSFDPEADTDETGAELAHREMRA